MSGSDPHAGESGEERQQRITKEIQFAQQRVIIDVLQEWHDRPFREIEAVLRKSLDDAGLPAAPEPWIRSVASEIAEDRLYVVAKEAVPSGYFDNESTQRAKDRVAGHGLGGSTEGSEEKPGAQRNDETTDGYSLPPKG